MLFTIGALIIAIALLAGFFWFVIAEGGANPITLAGKARLHEQAAKKLERERDESKRVDAEMRRRAAKRAAR